MTILRLVLLVGIGAACMVQAEASPIYAITTTNNLIAFDSASPGTTSGPVPITGLQSGESVVAMDFRPATGGLYGLGSTSRLYVINPSTGTATQVGAAGAFTLGGTAFGFDFNPVADRIRVTGSNGQNLRLNPNDGTVSGTDTSLAYASGDPNAATPPRIVGSAYSNNFAGAITTTLYGIDSALDLLAIQSPPNNGTLNTVGALGFNTVDLVGFDIQAGTGIAFAALTAQGANSSQLFTINLTTGASTLIGTIGGGTTITDIALPVGIPEPGTFGLLFSACAALWMNKFRKSNS